MYTQGITGKFCQFLHIFYKSPKEYWYTLGTGCIGLPGKSYVLKAGKETMNTRRVMLLSLLMIVTLLSAGSAGAASGSIKDALKDQASYIAPFCPDYYNWLNSKTSTPCQDNEGHGLGLIPAPVDLFDSSGAAPWETQESPVLVGYTVKAGNTVSNSGSQPVVSAGTANRFDLRTLGRVTPVRNQGQDGNCWAFASTGSLESSLLPGESFDFSENNEKNLHGFSVPINYGGNDFMATAYFTRWSGPVLESSDPYSDGSTTSVSGGTVVKHVQEVFFLPSRNSPLDNDEIKSVVRQYGALYSTLRYEDSSYNPKTAAYYYGDSASYNHAIDIVGWDDGYSRNNFNTPPPGDGAFIARNSWGSTWGEGGYFYISYYDTRIGRDNAMFTAESATDYARVYQYDPLGWVANFGLGSDSAYYANVFTSAGNEQVKAVGFYTTAMDTEYELRVYTNPDQGPISSAGFASTENGTIHLPGYHTIPLATPVNLKKGEKFSATVKVVAAGWKTPVAIELPIDGYSSEATAMTGQSYISASGAVWVDLTQYEPNTNVCLKVYTSVTGIGVTDHKPGMTIWAKSNSGTGGLLRNYTITSRTAKSAFPTTINPASSYNLTAASVRSNTGSVYFVNSSFPVRLPNSSLRVDYTEPLGNYSITKLPLRFIQV